MQVHSALTLMAATPASLFLNWGVSCPASGTLTSASGFKPPETMVMVCSTLNHVEVETERAD